MEKEKNAIKAMLESEGIIASVKEIKEMFDHVAVHQYFLGKKYKIPITWDDALFSWYENIFTMIIREISIPYINKLFPAYTIVQLYFALSREWYLINSENKEEEFSVEDALIKLINSSSPASSFSKFIFFAFFFKR